jgi:TonB family protein
MIYSCDNIISNINEINGVEMNKVKSGITGTIALLMSTLIHAVLIGGIIYASGMSKINKQFDKFAVNNALQQRYALLPDVEIIADRSALKHSEEKIQKSTNKEAFGTSKANSAIGGEADKSVFIYQDAVKRRIQESRFYPDEARKEGTQGSVEVSFAILPDGSLGHVSLMKSSGRTILDAEALSTIKRASPFPAFAGNIDSQQLDMQIAIVFKLN